VRRLARPCRLEQTFQLGLYRLEEKVGQAMQTGAEDLALNMQTGADGLAWTMETRAEGWPGHADQRRGFMQTKTRRLDRPCRTMQTRVEQKVGYLCRVWLKC
jgi:hypothetical protein